MNEWKSLFRQKEQTGKFLERLADFAPVVPFKKKWCQTFWGVMVGIFLTLGAILTYINIVETKTFTKCVSAVGKHKSFFYLFVISISYVSIGVLLIYISQIKREYKIIDINYNPYKRKLFGRKMQRFFLWSVALSIALGIGFMILAFYLRSVIRDFKGY